MFGKSFGEYFQAAKFGLLIITIVAIGRWGVSLAGVPYFPRGHIIFSLVLATTFLAIIYGGFLRQGYGFRLPQALVVVGIIAVYAQLLILLSTVISYAAGMESYFNHPEALNVDQTAVVGFGEALRIRVVGLFINTITSLIEGTLGFWFGGLLPIPGSNKSE